MAKMAEIFEITSDIKDIATKALNDLISQLGKNCKLVYPAEPQPCTSCSDKSHYPWGGEGTLSSVLCPTCNNKGVIYQEVSETVKFLLTWTPRDFTQHDLNIRMGDGYLQTKGFIHDFAKVKRCDHMIIQTDINNIVEYKYRLVGHPIDSNNIVQNKYFVAIWK